MNFAKTRGGVEGTWPGPPWREGRGVIAVFAQRNDPSPSYIMRLEWRDGRISFVRDYCYVRYATDGAELVLGTMA